jgi:protein phosphatase PTC7
MVGPLRVRGRSRCRCSTFSSSLVSGAPRGIGSSGRRVPASSLVRGRDCPAVDRRIRLGSAGGRAPWSWPRSMPVGVSSPSVGLLARARASARSPRGNQCGGEEGDLKSTVTYPGASLSVFERAHPAVFLTACAGLVTIGVALGSLVHRAVKLRREARSAFLESKKDVDNGIAGSGKDVSGQPLIFSEVEAKLMSPLLLAAETAAEVDETALMSVEELQDLEITLRTLVSGMDAQLEELKGDLMDRSILPDDVLQDLDTLHGDSRRVVDEMDGLWREFQLFQAYINDQERRTFRSLLYNRSVQMKLLRQVEKQIEAKTSGEEDWEGRSEEAQFGGTADPVGDSSFPVFYAAGSTTPHPRKVDKGGEDAFFVDSAAMVMGIADGVGGWAKAGIDPAAYSRDLMSHCEAAGSSGNASCIQILRRGFEKTLASGGCTCVLAKYLPMEGSSGRLDVVSIGDCGMRIVRDGEVVHKTEVQEHAQNQPFQLSHPSFNAADTPDDALEYSFGAVRGDVVILGSDGLWDNLWDEELVEAVCSSDWMRRSCDGPEGWQEEVDELSQRLVELAKAHSIDDTYQSPFSEGRRQGTASSPLRALFSKDTGYTGVGGKKDDITAVCAVIR